MVAGTAPNLHLRRCFWIYWLLVHTFEFQAGYFEKEFKRILEKEAYSDPVKIRRQERIRQSKKNIGKAFVPNAPTKLP